ncbi:Mne1p NDAI_0E03780 [Naumovozyma dairenensis CBS 421]|uniref:Uncharacterized protein n=1 Tax=Naumovozyma dairenensis (strain ATCC 10597 / BCRC 20456 / CBS 421 / NBRC 0211 / NRRL Y-12639) TaxID=1071378 RepID=G0WBS5_NAUDC|nr:hypothetical protein NDAI_0E03780 [Naumovozyma dairenensis CBS 421]CCD25195.1 hypothetical protein NDAI_0E03780 [Naumovozyma dairenensis CBS 421]
MTIFPVRAATNAWKRSISSNITSIVNDVLNNASKNRATSPIITGENITTENNISPRDKSASILSPTDKWIHESFTKYRGYLKKTGSKNTITLNLPQILRTLQILRSSDQTRSYFILLNRLNSTERINWISQNGKAVRLTNNRAPLELYNELSKMLYRQSLRLEDDSSNNDILAKLAMKLLREYYEIIMESQQAVTTRPIITIATTDTVPNSLLENTKFFKNCLSIIIKSKSFARLHYVLKKYIRNGTDNLSYYFAILSFYEKTYQIFKLKNYISMLSSFENTEVNLQAESDIKSFSSIIVHVTNRLLSNNMEETCIQFFDKLTRDWNYKMLDHDYNVILEMIEKYGSYKFLYRLKILFPDYSDSEISLVDAIKLNCSEKSLLQLIPILNDYHHKLESNESELRFLQCKLPPLYTNLKGWEDFFHSLLPTLRSSAITQNTKNFIMNLIISHVASDRSLGFMLLFLEHITYQLNLPTLLLSFQENRTVILNQLYHSLLRSMAVNPSANRLSLFHLFNWIKQNELDSFYFSEQDLKSIWKTFPQDVTIYTKSDSLLLNYYHNELSRICENTCIPNHLETLVSNNTKINNNQTENLTAVQIETVLLQVSGPVTDTLDLHELLDIEKKHEGGSYFFSIDKGNSQRLKDILQTLKSKAAERQAKTCE